MAYEELVTIVVLIVAMILFATEYLSVDLVGILIIVSLVLTGVLDPIEGVMGFSNSATITVAAMFVLSEALLKTGFLDTISGSVIKILKKKHPISITSMMAGVGGISAFINNTPVVATLIPVISNAARQAGKTPSKYLIPLSYGAILGGSCTLIGTSTNLLVSGIAEANGLDSFSMFLLLPFGLIMFATGIIYMNLIGYKLLPERLVEKDIKSQFQTNEYLTELTLGKNSKSVDKTIEEVFMKHELDVEILQVRRPDGIINNPSDNFILHANDILFIRGDVEKIKKIIRQKELELSEYKQGDSPSKDIVLLEVVILPNSNFVDKTIDNIHFSELFNANVLAIRQSGRVKYKNLRQLKLKSGDILLLQTDEKERKNILELESKRRAPFTSINEIPMHNLEGRKLGIVLATVATIVILATLGIVNIMVGALAGIVVLNLAGVITMQDAYKAIDWRVIFLLAGALSLGTAMTKSGLAADIADFLIYQIGTTYGKVILISVLYLTTSLLTEVMSNNAAAALLAPIAISISKGLYLDPIPLLLVITFAGSASFMTPVGYQTNTMVYSAGGYNFRDFLKVGTPLNIIFWLLATFLIPLIYPF